MITVKEIAWFAGVLEGEGYFSMVKNGRGKRYPSIVVAMNDEDIIARCAALLGASYAPLRRRKKTHKQSYRTCIRAGGAASWMMTILPLMGARRRSKIVSILKEWIAMPYLNSKGNVSFSRLRSGRIKGFDTTVPTLISDFVASETSAHGKFSQKE